SRRRHTRSYGDWSSDVCSSDLPGGFPSASRHTSERNQVKLRPEEITSILKQRIEEFDVETDLAEVGTVLQVGDGIARVYGLENEIGRASCRERVESAGGDVALK